MIFQKAGKEYFEEIKRLYWDIIEKMKDNSHIIGWKKGIYPYNEYRAESLNLGEMFVLRDKEISGCVILNSGSKEGYKGVKWSVWCNYNDVLIPHALAVKPVIQGKGVGRKLVKNIIKFAAEEGKSL